MGLVLLACFKSNNTNLETQSIYHTEMELLLDGIFVKGYLPYH